MTNPGDAIKLPDGCIITVPPLTNYALGASVTMGIRDGKFAPIIVPRLRLYP